MSGNIHAQAVSNVEESLKLARISVAGFSGVVIHTLDSETQVGGNSLPPGDYAVVEFKAVVPVECFPAADVSCRPVYKGDPGYISFDSTSVAAPAIPAGIPS